MSLQVKRLNLKIGVSDGLLLMPKASLILFRPLYFSFFYIITTKCFYYRSLIASIGTIVSALLSFHLIWLCFAITPNPQTSKQRQGSLSNKGKQVF